MTYFGFSLSDFDECCFLLVKRLLVFWAGEHRRSSESLEVELALSYFERLGEYL
jgi:hypothetical protein